MTYAPFEHAESLCIGTVSFVAPDAVRVNLDIEAPDSVALNTGGPRPFPRVNGYLLVPIDGAYLVGQVEWLSVEPAPFPKRRGLQDFGLVDLPYPQRKLSLNPLGMLRSTHPGGQGYVFTRGVEAFPSIGAHVILPTDAQLRSIVESGERRRVKIGTSPLAGHAEVRVDPDRLFGRHLAVLGNTGSGKSCSVAGLIRWSLEQAHAEKGSTPNARFIVLDPNGEYQKAFSGSHSPISARIFSVDPGTGRLPLRVPLWLWNSTEWCSFAQASARAQKPLLKRALREIRVGQGEAGASPQGEPRLQLRRYLSSNMMSLRAALRTGTIRAEETKFGMRLRAMHADLSAKSELFAECGLDLVIDAAQAALDSAYQSYPKGNKVIEYYRAFTEAVIERVVDAMAASLRLLGGIVYEEGPSEDAPIPFHGADFADHIEVIAGQEGASQFVDFLVARIRMLLADTRAKPILDDSEPVTLDGWLTDYAGGNDPEKGSISIIDLALVPTEVVHIVAAVVSRMVFEALQRYRKLKGATLPTVLVMEKAHTFVRRYRDDAESHQAEVTCCQVFERIAREGRKFGLGLVLSSQRPSELSQTVLSQCNSFLLHRISNDRDQELVQRLVPDNLRGFLRELPSLPSQNAILLGWASELPVLIKMNDLPRSQQPHSDDPDFWSVWTGKDADGKPVEREVDWGPIAREWQGIRSNGEHEDAP